MTIEFNREAYSKTFEDLERFKYFCSTAWLYGHNGYVFDEKNLYNEKSRAWQAYQRYVNGGKRKNNNAGRFASNQRN